MIWFLYEIQILPTKDIACNGNEVRSGNLEWCLFYCGGQLKPCGQNKAFLNCKICHMYGYRYPLNVKTESQIY